MWFYCFGIQILHLASFKATSRSPLLACLHAKCVVDGNLALHRTLESSGLLHLPEFEVVTVWH